LKWLKKKYKFSILLPISFFFFIDLFLKLEIITLENTTLKEKYEEVQLELDVIKSEIQLNGPNQVANDIQQKIHDERTIKMEQALIK
jgi:hypothetical protein